MGRSEQAIQRRAAKRERTEKEQRTAERLDIDRRERRLRGAEGKTPTPTPTSTLTQPSPPPPTATDTPPPTKPPPPTAREEDPLNEAGAWTCPGCHNANYASRRSCHSRTCEEVRPDLRSSSAPRPSPSTGSRSKPNVRHDVATSRNQHWSAQASGAVVDRNVELRRRYRETLKGGGAEGGEGMEEEDVVRARVLIARDERKREKKGRKGNERLKGEVKGQGKAGGNDSGMGSAVVGGGKGRSVSIDETKLDGSSSTVTAVMQKGQPDAVEGVSGSVGQGQPVASSSSSRCSKTKHSKLKRDRKKALRKQYLETGGKGMKPELIERAKILIEKKRKRKVEADQ